MALSLLPVSAFAAEPEGGSTTPTSYDQASVTVGTDTYYFRAFHYAVAYAQQNSGCTLKLLDNVGLYDDFTISNFTLDGGEHTLSPGYNSSIAFSENAKITGGNFTVSVTLWSGAKLSGGSYTALTTREGPLTNYLADGCAFYNATTDEQLSSDDLNNSTRLSNVKVKESATPVCKHPNEKVTNGRCECGQEFTASTTIAGANPVWHVNYSSAAETFKNADPSVTLKLWKDCNFGYILSGTGTLDLNGKTLTAQSSGITSSFGATASNGNPLHTNITIEDSGSNGKIAGKVKIIFNAAITIKGGTFDEISVGQDAGTVILTGGTYGTLTVAAGKTLNSLLGSGCKYYDASGSEITVPDNQLTLKNVTVKSTGGGQDSPNDVAQVDGKNYTDLNEAINAAKASGKPVKLLKDIAESVTLAEALTLDLNGKNITGTLTISNDGVMLAGASGTITELVITVEGKTLLDVLNSAFAYQKDGKIINGAKPQLANVQIVLHSCTFDEASTTCACGRVKDTTPPVITYTNAARIGTETSSSGYEQNFVEVHGNTLTFTITDDTAVKSVKINGESVSPSNDGKYSIEIDDERSEVDDNQKRGYQPVRIIAEDTAGNSIEWYFIAYRMVETKITQVPEGIKILSICGDPVTTDTGKTADASRWRRAASPYWVEFQVEDQPWFKAEEYLKLYLFHTGDYSARYELSCKTSDGNYRFTTVVGNEVNADSHLATALKKNRESFSYDQLQDIHIVRKADQIAPATTISFKDKAYTTFTGINQTIAYELFYQNSLTVDVTATDDNSGVASAKYLFTETKYTETQLQNATDWQTFSLTASAEDPATYTGRFTLNAGKLGTKGFLYVRTKDNANNTTNVSANKGLVIYKDAVGTNTTITKDLYEVRTSPVPLPVNSGSSANKVVFTCKDTSGNPIQVNPPVLPSLPNDYTIYSDGTVALTYNFLKKLTVGTYTLTITIDPMEEEYKDIAGNDKPTTVTVTLNVTKNTRTVKITNDISKVYDGTPVGAPQYTLSDGRTDTQQQVTFAYKVKGANDDTYTAIAPTAAGTYTVRVSVTGHSDYIDVSDEQDFTISQREITVTGVEANDKVYDGTATASIVANSGVLSPVAGNSSSGKVDGDDVSFIISDPKFENKKVGENKSVTFTVTLTGDAASNYTLVQPDATTASITPRLATINGLAVDNKTYDGKPDATISADLTLTLAPVANNADSGIVPNDDVTLNPTAAKAEFKDKNAGADKPVTFSDFALTGADAGNYTLVLPTDVTATIERKTLTVDGLKIADKTYDGTKTAQWDGTPTLIGLVEGETLQLICGVPTFTSATPGSNIPVTFTPFSLADGTGLAANYTLIQPVSGSITGNIVVNRHNHSRGPRPYLPQQPANGANGTNGGKDGVTSARTGDMGVALYAALSLASLSGTALLTRKRKETL